MPLGRFLVHRVQVERRAAVLDGGDPTYDDYGQPVTADTDVLTDVPAAIQPLRAREVANLSQGGATVSSHRIFLFPIDINTADVVVHDPALCPMPAATDLDEGRYELDALPQGAGVGQHLEALAHLVETPMAAVAGAEVS